MRPIGTEQGLIVYSHVYLVNGDAVKILKSLEKYCMSAPTNTFLRLLHPMRGGQWKNRRSHDGGYDQPRSSQKAPSSYQNIWLCVCVSADGNWREGEMLGWWNNGPAIHEKGSKKTTILYFSSILFGWMGV
jgi:hypothetical protein